MDENTKKLKQAVNSSGFPLQIGIEHFVEKTSGSHGWKVLYTEHSWKNLNSNNSGFIDLVLTDEFGTSIMVVECKRVQNTNWIFLLPSERQKRRRHARAWVSRSNGDNVKYFDWADITPDPFSPESMFCIVPGQDKKSRPMLERIAAELIEATEALAYEDLHLFSNKPDFVRIYLNVIITTADLSLCSFDPNDISISNGKIEKAAFESVPYLRFRKSLSTKPVVELNLEELSSYNLIRAKENTVFVVNSEHLNEFLNEIEIGDNIFRSFE
ncbi:MAG: hypothetical protein JRJ38_18545 [Deltaproteobacteria bacterium]|nr:hypothetical protein [Deltaproteobacteria bacterium]